jgi:hypothetical protein
MCYRGPDGHCLGLFCIYMNFIQNKIKMWSVQGHVCNQQAVVSTSIRHPIQGITHMNSCYEHYSKFIPLTWHGKEQENFQSYETEVLFIIQMRVDFRDDGIRNDVFITKNERQKDARPLLIVKLSAPGTQKLSGSWTELFFPPLSHRVCGIPSTMAHIRCVRLVTRVKPDVHLESRLRMQGSLPPLIQYTFGRHCFRTQEELYI